MEPSDHTIASSPDIVAQNIDKLRELFPECFTEGSDDDGPRFKVDFEALKETLGDYVEDKEERYSFTWSGKARARRIAQTPSTGTLRPCPEESANWDTTHNLFIEGDNLEVLKLLQKSYHRKVKMIYIDPPYNTGKEFIYPDRFQENLDTYLRFTGQVSGDGFKVSANTETTGRYHTNWLNMMLPRLKLARNLLSDNGVLFASIDDHEVHNLKALCDEVFGQENFIAQLTVQVNPRGRHLDRFVASTHEYVLVYGRDSIEPTTMHPLPKEGRMVAEYRKEDTNGKYRDLELRNRNPAFNSQTRPNLYYPLYLNPESSQVSVHQSTVHSVEVFPKNSSGDDSCWTWSSEKVQREGDLLVGRQVQGGGWRVYRKDYLEKNGKVAGTLPKSVWVDKDVNHDYGKKAIQQLLGASVMDFPKSPQFMQRLVRIGTAPGSIVLDFFAGSCPLGEAVLRQNSEDSGTRRYILVQLPEPTGEDSAAYQNGYETIADIGKARLRAVKDSIESDESLLASTPDSTVDLGFRVYQLAASNIKLWDADFDRLEDDVFAASESIKEDRTQQDVLYELLLKFGLDLCVPIEERAIADKMVFLVGAGALVVCLDEDITLEVVEGIAALKDELQPEVMRVVFRDSGFKDDVVKTNAVQILKQAGLSDEHIRSI